MRAQCKTRSFSIHKMRVELYFVFMSSFYDFVRTQRKLTQKSQLYKVNWEEARFNTPSQH